MKLLFIIYHIANCGAERVLALVANELCNRGYEVYILTNPRKISYALDERIVLLDAYGDSMSDGTSKYGNLKNNIKGLFRLRNAIRSIRPDYIISFMGMFIWQLLLYRHRYKIIISDHTAMNAKFGLKRDFERHHLSRLFYRYVVLTQGDKEFFDENSSNNIAVIGNPLTYEIIDKEEYNYLFEKRSNLLVCASVDRWRIKGLDNMLRSFAIVHKAYPTTTLTIAGSGSKQNKAYLQCLGNQLGVGENIFFMGFVEDVASLMKKYLIYVCPSRVEGFGMSITEAMSCGLPVVSFSLSGPKEIISNEYDGILVDNQNNDELSSGIIKLLNDDALRYNVGLNALKSVERYSLSVVVDKWETLFKF